MCTQNTLSWLWPLAAAAVLNGCVIDVRSDEKTPQSIVGEWVGTYDETKETPSRLSHFRFRDDGTFILSFTEECPTGIINSKVMAEATHGTWAAIDGLLSLQQNKQTSVHDYHWNKDTLIISGIDFGGLNGTDQKLVHLDKSHFSWEPRYKFDLIPEQSGTYDGSMNPGSKYRILCEPEVQGHLFKLLDCHLYIQSIDYSQPDLPMRDTVSVIDKFKTDGSLSFTLTTPTFTSGEVSISFRSDLHFKASAFGQTTPYDDTNRSFQLIPNAWSFRVAGNE